MQQQRTGFADRYFEPFAEAHQERVRRVAAQSEDNLMITRIEESPYGGYVVRSIPADVYVDLVAEVPGGFGGRRRITTDTKLTPETESDTLSDYDRRSKDHA